jgi:hypothetical protein
MRSSPSTQRCQTRAADMRRPHKHFFPEILTGTMTLANGARNGRIIVGEPIR